eukprot:SAG25_NODE_130_length_14421_cov_71.473886_21_plen_87_part_00
MGATQCTNLRFYTKVNDNCLCSPLTDIRCAMEPNPYCCMLFQQGTCSLRPHIPICPESNSLPEAPRLILLVFQSKFPLRNCSSPHL